MGGSPPMWIVTVCVCVLGFFSLDLCGFLVHGEIFSSCGCSVGNGLRDSSHLERFLATPWRFGGKPIKATPFEEPLQN
uniref:Uncharacterized protein n=1 Tax=Fagus sylvatica TaxID=28930 RepID=A0A2N9G6T2_FAGSY